MCRQMGCESRRKRRRNARANGGAGGMCRQMECASKRRRRWEVQADRMHKQIRRASRRKQRHDAHAGEGARRLRTKGPTFARKRRSAPSSAPSLDAVRLEQDEHRFRAHLLGDKLVARRTAQPTLGTTALDQRRHSIVFGLRGPRGHPRTPPTWRARRPRRPPPHPPTPLRVSASYAPPFPQGGRLGNAAALLQPTRCGGSPL